MHAHSDSAESKSPGGATDFCHNCGIRLFGPYCAACGQKAVPLSVTVHEFVHELTHETLHVDGRIFQSVRRLLLSPGFLTREYIQGHRVRWISPIRLYLMASVVFFALGAISPAGSIEITATASDERDVAEAVQRLGYENVHELQEVVSHSLLVWVPRAMFVLLPVFAWFVAMAYTRVDPNYLHHLYFALHMHAAWFSLGALSIAVKLAIPAMENIVSSVMIVYALIYTLGAFRSAYGGSAAQTMIRTFLIVTAYAFVVCVALAAIVAPAVLGRRWWSAL